MTIANCAPRLWLSAGLLLLGLSAPAAAQSTRVPRVAITWDRFYDYHGIVELCERLAASRPELCRLEYIGPSWEGRPMPLLTLSNPATGPESGKSAMWVDGNVHGNEVQGAEAAVYLAWLLLERHGELPQLTELLDERVFYILPMVNPDGRQHWFDEPNTPSSSRSGTRPLDSDRDGRADEDGADDLDGDGELLSMRKRVEPGTGTHRLSPTDARVLESVPAEKRAEWGADYVMLGQEGLDNDGDGRVNEDGPGGYDMNRNWPSDWQPNHIQFGAGDFPFSYPETAAIGAFLRARPHVAAVQSFHNSGGMILRGPGTAAREGLYGSSDRRTYDAIANEGAAMLPFYRSMVIWKDLYDVHGGFVNWTAEGLGIISFTNEMWNDEQYFASADVDAVVGDDSQRQRLLFDRRLMFGETYVDWHPVEHPQYGPIEVGGFRKMTGRVPPAFMIEEMLHRNAAFCLFHAEQMPKLSGSLRVDPVAGTAPGSALHYVTAELRNERWIPTRSALAAEHGIGRPDLVTLEGTGLVVVAGGDDAERFELSRFDAVEHEPARLQLEQGVPGHGLVRLRWLVSGRGPFRVTVQTEKAGTLTLAGSL
ncbi:MAG: M14 family metallopeptidase [Planctomycetota bacterium]